MTTSDHGNRSAARHAADANLAPSSAPPPDAAADDTSATTSGSVTGPPDDIQELRQEIDETREQLGDTVQQLAAKTDVGARARDKAVELTQKVRGKASQTQAQAAASAGNARSQVADKTEAARQHVMPVVSAGKDQLQARAAAVATPVLEATPEPVRQAAVKAATTIRQRHAPLAVAASALVAGYLAVRWRRRR
jgi:Protein of unknown function (DUF3618)